MQIIYLQNSKNEIMKVTTGIFFDTRRAKKDGTYPVKLRITQNRRSKMYKTDFSFSISDFEKIMTDGSKRKYKDDRNALATIETDAQKIIKKIPVFTFENFEKKYYQGNFDSANLFSYFEEKIVELVDVESFKTAEVYQCAHNSISDFHRKRKLTLLDVTPTFLRKYELWMRDSKRSITTTSMYLRSLRHIFNRSAEENQFDSQLYPFTKRKYKIPQPRNIKIALNLNEIKLLYKYQAEEGSIEEFYRDIWMFSYLCNGINVKDICLLKNKDVQGKHIYFRREKTKNTSRSSLPIDVPLTNDTKIILDRWADFEGNPDNYVFPFLTYDLTPKEQVLKFNSVTKLILKYINQVAQNVGIEKRITTKTARHSYASTLNRLGVNISFIGQHLGHKNTSTTEHYLASIEDDEKLEIANKLLDFS